MKRVMLFVLLVSAWAHAGFAQHSGGSFEVHIVPGSNFRLILAHNVDGIFDGFEQEFGLLYMPGSVFNPPDWYTGHLPSANFSYFFQRGFRYIGVYDSTDGDRNIAVINIGTTPNIQ